MIVVEAKEARERLDMATCIRLMREGLSALENGSAMQPLRSVNKLPHGNLFGFMPAYLGDGDYFGAKVITAFHDNIGTEYPSHMGYVMIFEAVHGSFVGMADCGVITEIRTGAVSGVATDLLAVKNAKKLALIGAGAQARSHLAAMLEVRPGLSEVAVYDIRTEAAEKFAAESEEKYHIPVHVCADVQTAVQDADIICTLTPSKDPYLKREWIKKGAHINAVGTFTPVTREVTSELVAASKLYADQIEAMEKEAGEYLIPLSEGLITREHIRGSIGGLLTGKAEGRTSDEDITLFDALGLAVEDVICGRFLVCGR